MDATVGGLIRGRARRRGFRLSSMSCSYLLKVRREASSPCAAVQHPARRGFACFARVWWAGATFGVKQGVGSMRLIYTFRSVLS